jgi:hypothetical protein
MICRKYSFQKLTQFSLGNKALYTPASYSDGFLRGIHEFFLSSWIALLDQTEPMATLKHVCCRKYSCQNINGFSQGNSMVDAAACNTVGLFGEIYVSFQLGWIGQLGGNWPHLPLKHLTCRKYFCQNLNRFLQGNKMLDAAASNIDGFCWRDSWVFSTQPNRLSWSKQSLCPPWELWLAWSIHHKK